MRPTINSVKPAQFIGFGVMVFILLLIVVALLAPVFGYHFAFLDRVLTHWEAPAFFAFAGLCAALD